MDALRLFALLIYTFGAFAYGAMLLMWIRELGAVGWADRRSTGTWNREADLVNGTLLVISFSWFVCNVAQLLVQLTPQRQLWQVDVANVLLAFAFPPLIMHITWAEVSVASRAVMSRAWRYMLWPAYGFCTLLPLWLLGVSFPSADDGVVRDAAVTATAGLSAAFVAAAVYSTVLISRSPSSEFRSPSRDALQARRSLLGLFAAMALIFLLMLWVAATGNTDSPMTAAVFLLQVTAKSLPLLFVFVSTYFEDRFQFFDLFVKRGAAFLVAIGVLTVWFALTLPFARPLVDTWAAPWVYAVALIPAVGAISWISRRVASALDRRWLGRRYTTVSALTRFVSALRSVTSQAEAIERAERALTEIFGARAAIRLGADGREALDFDVQQRVPIDVPTGTHGAILMGRRSSDAPYFSEDVALLSSLAGILGAVLDNLELQQRRREHEQRAHELSLHASRSELKALRAQINPHFLFNALNAIAGLIHRNPGRADRTIEQLADVFRYALRSSEDEWTTLGEELQFVQSYLEVERARFGERLEAEVRVGREAATARIPTMMVHTLVENAVKHGLAEVRGTARISVEARAGGDRLTIVVIDNGPGFQSSADGRRSTVHGRQSVESGQPASAPNASDRGGYGLANIRERLRGYFGDRAALTIGRDQARGLTTVSIEMPAATAAPAAQSQGIMS